MPRLSRESDVPYTPAQMYDLVADVEAYPEFLPWCENATVHEQSDTHQIASVAISQKFRQSSFKTRNRLDPKQAIHLTLVDGPFEHLEGQWRFVPRESGGCRVALDIDFQFSSRLLAAAISPAFRRVADSLVRAFAARAAEVYPSRGTA